MENIQKLGLLSTSALLDRFEVNSDRRFVIESVRRSEIVALEHTEHGRALVRDNKPMHESVLERCLAGMTSRDWYETLDRRVFFWVDYKRLVRLLGAKAYRDRPHLVLELETAELLRRHREKVSLSPINSGATFTMNPAPRGAEHFPPHRGPPAGKGHRRGHCGLRRSRHQRTRAVGEPGTQRRKAWCSVEPFEMTPDG